jgi:hypothetical protein
MVDTSWHICGPGTIAADSLRDRADNLEQWRTLPGVLADLAILLRILYEIERTILNHGGLKDDRMRTDSNKNSVLFFHNKGQQQWTNLFIFLMLYTAFCT